MSFSTSKSLFSRLWEPLADDFGLSSGPSHPPKPNKTEHKTKNTITCSACSGRMAARRLPRSVRRSAALLHSVERVTAFQIKATTLASSSSCL